MHPNTCQELLENRKKKRGSERRTKAGKDCQTYKPSFAVLVLLWLETAMPHLLNTWSPVAGTVGGRGTFRRRGLAGGSESQE
jgi:hypothetical protein